MFFLFPHKNNETWEQWDYIQYKNLIGLLLSGETFDFTGLD